MRKWKMRNWNNSKVENLKMENAKVENPKLENAKVENPIFYTWFNFYRVYFQFFQLKIEVLFSNNAPFLYNFS